MLEPDLGQDFEPELKYKKYSYPSNFSIKLSTFCCKVDFDEDI